MKRNPLAIILLSMPGGGKETVQKLLSQQYMDSLFTSDTGSLFRSAIRDRPDTIIKLNESNKKRLAEINDSGKLQCSALATAMWASHFLFRYTGEPFIIIDGSPRRKEEADVLIQFLEEYVCADIRYVYVQIEKEIAIQRMKERHKKNPRPETSSEKSIKERIKDFEEKNAPVINYLYERHKSSGNFTIIDNNGSLEQLEKQLKDFSQKVLNHL